MFNHNIKTVFYFIFYLPMKVSGILYRRFKAPRKGAVKVQLGSGQIKYISGWINVDANILTAKVDVWADLRNPLPFNDNSIDQIYSHHAIEHLSKIEYHFKEVYRCLKPGGVYRVGGPNGDSAIAKFVENDKQWFIDFPDKRNSIGGRFENFVFCRGEHLTILTYSFLEEIMTNAGFTDLRLCKPVKETNYPELFHECLSLEGESDFAMPHTLIIEGVKPR